ncbi:MAG TPA: CBS domain-containing protein [Polyangia bacterium]|nr:CBS domain-containing protein [Polyangia bacterium]
MNTYRRAIGTVGWRWSGLRSIGELMREAVAVVRREDRVVTVMALLRANGASHAAVMRAGEVEGVVAQHDLDALCWMLRGSTAAWIKELLVEDVMQTPPLVLEAEATVYEAARMLREGTRECIVILTQGHPVGIITEPDLHPPPASPADALLPPDELAVAQGTARR